MFYSHFFQDAIHIPLSSDTGTIIHRANQVICGGVAFYGGWHSCLWIVWPNQCPFLVFWYRLIHFPLYWLFHRQLCLYRLLSSVQRRPLCGKHFWSVTILMYPYLSHAENLRLTFPLVWGRRSHSSFNLMFYGWHFIIHFKLVRWDTSLSHSIDLFFPVAIMAWTFWQLLSWNSSAFVKASRKFDVSDYARVFTTHPLW